MASLDPKLLYRFISHQSQFPCQPSIDEYLEETLFVNYPWVMLKEYDYDEETKLKET